MLPRVSVPTVLKEIHNAPTGGHLGVKKTMEKPGDSTGLVNVKMWRTGVGIAQCVGPESHNPRSIKHLCK